jgi:hypothetical protein
MTLVLIRLLPFLSIKHQAAIGNCSCSGEVGCCSFPGRTC